ncbi:MAG: trypsin-like peptidase domain-containing protein [Planctomycetaceae bacterium]
MNSTRFEQFTIEEHNPFKTCEICRQEFLSGETACRCSECGTLHHAHCWTMNQGCGSFRCNRLKSSSSSREEVLKITTDELVQAQPQVVTSRFQADESRFDHADFQRTQNRLAIWSFAIALLGIPLFGLVVGLIAIVLACIAMVSHTGRKKGLGFAVAAMLIGLADVIGWSVGLAYYWGETRTAVSFSSYTIDPESLKNMPPTVSRSMYANVLVLDRIDFMHHGLGSGIILRVSDSEALILTNRHVIDNDYSDSTFDVPDGLKDKDSVSVQLLNGSEVPAKIVWVAPHGVDLALLSIPRQGQELQNAVWDLAKASQIGDPVYAIGNPHGLGWTHSEGNVSQVRLVNRKGFEFRIFQSTVPLNQGNSGGGLYNHDGLLIGVNSSAGDPKVSTGLGFSISLETLFELIPESFGLSRENSGAVTP